MDVQLYMYDLTHGMARNVSRQLLGIQIDAVYHTAIVFDGIEYFFGAGVQTCYAGSTHHGKPIEIISLGSCSLSKDVVLEYLESLKEIYTPESYDLFAHNCNNFSNDFATFLVGRGIPEHITNLPQKVLDTPFGQMLRPQIDASMRSITQAPVPAQNVRGTSRTAALPSSSVATASSSNRSLPSTQIQRYGQVISVTRQDVLEKHLKEAKDTCATIFFTSATCPPCKLVYGPYDSLAAEHAEALFVKIDLDEAREIAMKWQVRATPSFVTFVLGERTDAWSGADPRQLKTNVERALNTAFPPHPHSMVNVPKLQFDSMKATTYAKTPPLEKLILKLGAAGNTSAIKALHAFIETRQKDPKDATLPELSVIAGAYRTTILQLPLEVRFAAIDLLRCAMVDPRVSGYFAEDLVTIDAVVNSTTALGEQCPHNLRLVTIHLLCNCFSSHLFIKEAFATDDQPLLSKAVHLITSSLLDNAHSTTRVAATSLAFNLSIANYRLRREEQREGISDELQVELAASLLECMPAEDNEEALKGLLLSLAYLVYFARVDGELLDLCKALEAKAIVSACKHHTAFAQEIARLL